MSHEDKSVTPVTTDAPGSHHFGRPRYPALLCSGGVRSGLQVKAERACQVKDQGFPGEGGPGEQLKPASTRTCVILLEAARPLGGLTLSEFQDIMLSLRLALGSPGDV